MRLTRWIITLSLALVTTATFGQTRSMDELADQTLNVLTTSFPVPDSLFITLEAYHVLIERQPMPHSDKSAFKQEINNDYPGLVEQYKSALDNLQRIFVNEVSLGATIEVDSVWLMPVEDTRNIYEIKIDFVISNPDEDEDFHMYFDSMVASTRKRFAFISPLIESYE